MSKNDTVGIERYGELYVRTLVDADDSDAGPLTHLKYPEMLPILNPITNLRSLVPSTSNTSSTGPNLLSTDHITLNR